MDRDKLLELASRVEAATGPDRPLSWEIWEAVGKPIVDDWSRDGSAPGYTASLDAAVTLLPQGWTFFVQAADHEWKDTTAYACVAGPIDMVQRGWNEPPEAGRTTIDAHAATTALALTAASLRALAQLGASHD